MDFFNLELRLCCFILLSLNFCSVSFSFSFGPSWNADYKSPCSLLLEREDNPLGIVFFSKSSCEASRDGKLLLVLTHHIPSDLMRRWLCSSSDWSKLSSLPLWRPEEVNAGSTLPRQLPNSFTTLFYRPKKTVGYTPVTATLASARSQLPCSALAASEEKR